MAFEYIIITLGILYCNNAYKGIHIDTGIDKLTFTILRNIF